MAHLIGYGKVYKQVAVELLNIAPDTLKSTVSLGQCRRPGLTTAPKRRSWWDKLA